MFFRKKTKLRKPLFRRIINGFIYSGVGFIFLLLLVFGFTQTKTFREWLRETVIEEVSSATNGQLAIERIDGTILTSLILSNTVYTINQDTLLIAEKIELKTSPLKLIFKIIYLRKLEITNAKIAFFKDNSGELNISKVFQPSQEEAAEDSVSSEFTFKFEAADLSLNDVDFLIQSDVKRNSREFYDHPEFDDFRLNNINLNLYAFADLSNEEFILKINHFSVEPNLKNFLLKDLSLDAMVVDDDIWLRDFRLITAKSDVSINAVTSGYRLIGDNEEHSLENALVRVDLSAINFNFDDLSTFIEGTGLLKGNISAEINVAGTLKELDLKQLLLVGENTSLEGTGMLNDVTSGKDMKINVRFTDSYVDQIFVDSLLNTIEIPHFTGYGILKLDTLFFTGKPLNFISGVNLTTEKGMINLSAALDLEKEDMVYDIRLAGSELDLSPIINISSNLNFSSKISGTGTNPETMKSEINFSADNSQFFNSGLQSFNYNAKVSEGKLNSQLDFILDNSSGNLTADMVMNNFENPAYNFSADINRMDISVFTGDQSHKSNLNFQLTGEGENFSTELLNLFLILSVDSSTVNEFNIESTRLIADIRSDTSHRVLNLVSDLADITFTGKFKPEDLISMLAVETSLLASTIENKINEIQPPESFVDKPDFGELMEDSYPEISEEIINTELSVDYLVEFKDFELLSLMLGDSDMEINGEINGSINSFPDSIEITLNTDIEHFKFWDGSDLIYISDLILSSSINDKITDLTFNNFKMETGLKAHRIFAESEIADLEFNLTIDETNADINLKASVDKIAEILVSGEAMFDENFLEIFFDKIYLSYNDYIMSNKDEIVVAYSDNNVEFKSFALTHNPGDFNISGNFSFTGDENLSINFSEFWFNDIAMKLLELPPQNSPDAIFELNAKLKGTASAPVMDLNFALDSVKFSKTYLGSFDGNVNYLNESLNVGIDFNESSGSIEIPKLKINGSVPINLALNGKDIMIKDRAVDINFTADKIDLQIFNAFLPMLNNLKGSLEANASFQGTFDDIVPAGKFNLINGSFVLPQNNLPYNFGFEIILDKDLISLSNFYLSNGPNTKGGGTLGGNGQLWHRNFVPETAEFYLSGDLKLLSQETKSASPTLFGDIAIRTNGDIVYKLNDNINLLKADITIKKGATITYSPIQTAFSNENDKFIYVFAKDENAEQQDKQIDSLIVVSEATKRKAEQTSGLPFDLDIKISVEDEIKSIYVLSREFDQNLTAYLGGNFEYILIDQEPIARGELRLLDGSNLEFIKSFQASGSIKFLTEIDNPYLDVTATYQNYYNPDTLRSSSNEIEVMIQLKLEGPLKNLNTSFVRNEENISVYKRPSGRGQFELDATKSASDAMMFIILGKFPEDATVQETNLAVSTAASLAGSIVGGYLNEKLGDYVRSFQVRQSGTETKFSLVGKAGSFKYEIGGTSQMFQDLSRANVKIEYPVPITPGLIVRLERREPIFESSTASQMINELGLKYSFEF